MRTLNAKEYCNHRANHEGEGAVRLPEVNILQAPPAGITMLISTDNALTKYNGKSAEAIQTPSQSYYS